MTDSVPKLRRLLNEAQEEIRELKSRAVPVQDRVITVHVPFDVEKIIYRDVYKTVEVPIEVPVDRPVPFEVERVVYRDVEKEVVVNVPVYPEKPIYIETVRVEYKDNPEHIESIKKLQEKLCQFTSQSDS